MYLVQNLFGTIVYHPAKHVSSYSETVLEPMVVVIWDRNIRRCRRWERLAMSIIRCVNYRMRVNKPTVSVYSSS